MATLFKNSYSLNIGTSFIKVLECGEEKSYSVISGMTIANKKLNEIQVTVRIIDSTNLVTAYLISDSKLSVGSSLALCGDLQKLVLKNGDSLEVMANESDAVDVMISYIDNDPSIFYPIPPAVWYGDVAFITGGESYTNQVSEFVFSTRTASSNISTMSPYGQWQAGASNSIIGLIIGGYESSGETDAIKSREFASRVIDYGWATLGISSRISEAASNGNQWIMMGGYHGNSNVNYMQFGSFDAGIVSGTFGNLYANIPYHQMGAAGNSIYAIGLGGWSGTNRIQFVEHATQADATIWGYMREYAYYNKGAANEERLIYKANGGNNSEICDYIEFASQSDGAFWGNMGYNNYELGACSNSLEILFVCGEQYSYSHIMDMTTNTNGTLITDIGLSDGGYPLAETGNV